MKTPNVSQKTFYFWGRGKKIPERVVRRAVRYVKGQCNLSASLPAIAPHVRFSQILRAGVPFRHGVGINIVFFSAITGEVAGKKEGIQRTVDLISRNTDIYLIQGRLKGPGSISTEALNIINEESSEIGFMYVVNKSKIGITTQPGIVKAEIQEVFTSIQEKFTGIRFAILSLREIIADCQGQLLNKGPLGLYHQIMRMLDSR
jgi:hypothetical protein